MNPYQQDFEMNRALTEQQIQGQYGMNAPNMVQQQQELQAALVAQTDPSALLEEVELKLKGYRLRNGQYTKISNPLMNDAGINRMLFILSSVVNQNTILSHLEIEEIGRLIIQVNDDVIDDLVINWKEYGIKDKMLLDHIVDVTVIPCFMSLKRAWKQNEKNWLNKAVIETISSQPKAPKKEGFMSKIKL